MNKFFTSVILASMLLGSFGCAAGAPDPLNPDVPVVAATESCEYTIAETKFGNYVDENGREYNIVVDSPVAGIENYLSANEVAELASMLVDEHAKLGLFNNEQVYNMLSHGHFIVAADNDEFANLYLGDEPYKIAGFIHVLGVNIDPCWDNYPAGVNWTSVVRPNEWSRTTTRVVIHEMIHAVSAAMYGHTDNDHSNPVLWDGFENSLHERVTQRFNCEYWPQSCQE